MAKIFTNEPRDYKNSTHWSRDYRMCVVPKVANAFELGFRVMA